jgi:HAD superfamily hydrolase (TIGR01509 family)
MPPTDAQDTARAAVFDVDGTLVDTNYLHVAAWWEALRQAGHDVPSQAIHRAIGLGSSDLVAHLLGADRAREYFGRLTALPEAGQLLRRLADDGWKVVLATSAGGQELSALRTALDADEAISGMASADDVSEGKPAPEPVQRALKLAGATPERSVFVGDTVWDMQAGSRAGVTCVGLLCGGIPREDLEKAGADVLYDGPDALLASLAQSPLGRRP